MSKDDSAPEKDDATLSMFGEDGGKARAYEVLAVKFV